MLHDHRAVFDDKYSNFGDLMQPVHSPPLDYDDRSGSVIGYQEPQAVNDEVLWSTEAQWR